jgi:hypothetical protein
VAEDRVLSACIYREMIADDCDCIDEKTKGQMDHL